MSPAASAADKPSNVRTRHPVGNRKSRSAERNEKTEFCARSPATSAKANGAFSSPGLGRAAAKLRRFRRTRPRERRGSSRTPLGTFSNCPPSAATSARRRLATSNRQSVSDSRPQTIRLFASDLDAGYRRPAGRHDKTRRPAAVQRHRLQRLRHRDSCNAPDDAVDRWIRGQTAPSAGELSSWRGGAARVERPELAPPLPRLRDGAATPKSERHSVETRHAH